MKVFGELRCFVPVVSFFAQDSKEGDALCAKFGAWNAARPCRLCLTKFQDMNNIDCPDYKEKPRTVHDMRAQVLPLVAKLQEGKRGCVRDARNAGGEAVVARLQMFTDFRSFQPRKSPFTSKTILCGTCRTARTHKASLAQRPRSCCTNGFLVWRATRMDLRGIWLKRTAAWRAPRCIVW